VTIPERYSAWWLRRKTDSQAADRAVACFGGKATTKKQPQLRAADQNKNARIRSELIRAFSRKFAACFLLFGSEWGRIRVVTA
jgi:hypothetical protein